MTKGVFPSHAHLLFWLLYARNVKQRLVAASAIFGFVSTSGLSVATAFELKTLHAYTDSI
jgi:hypothetical protein